MLGTTPLHTGPFVTVDIETTGCRPGSSGIIEIGAVRLESGVITGHFSTLVRPPEPIPPAVRQLTGIDDDMVAGAPDIASVIAEFREFVGDAVLVAHNHRFDMGFLDFEAERSWGMPFPRPVLDTLSLARRLHPELSRHNLRVLAEFYGAESTPNHRAFPDALATAEILRGMLSELTANGFATAGDAAGFCGLARQGNLARKLALATHLPDAPGIYLFRDENGTVVFIGRAKSLRARVRSHFYAPGELGSAHPGDVVASIDHVVCVSPLDALLLESRLMTRYQPAYNRQHHRMRHPVYIHAATGGDYPGLRVTRRRLRGGELHGPVSNEWAARRVTEALSRHFGLRMCTGSLEARAERPCSRRGRGMCPEPCSNAVPSDAYAVRVRAALDVLDGGGPRFRAALQTLRDEAVAGERYEEAILYRDAVHALDRTLSALDVVARAMMDGVVVLVEGDVTGVAAHVVVHGFRFATLRFTQADIAAGSDRRQVALAIAHATARAARPVRITPRRLRDILIIDAYRQQHAPSEIAVGTDHAAAAARVSSSLRRTVRTPRKRHVAP